MRPRFFLLRVILAITVSMVLLAVSMVVTLAAGVPIASLMPIPVKLFHDIQSNVERESAVRLSRAGSAATERCRG